MTPTVRRTLIAGVVVVALLLTGAVFLVMGVSSRDQAVDCSPATPTVATTGPQTDGIDTAVKAAFAAGWRGRDLIVAVAVAGAESNYDRMAANSGSTARGMWQIMMSFHQPKFRPGETWQDPYANARVAHIIWTAAGDWTPWVAHTSGAYLKYVAPAQAAVERLGQPDAAAAVPAVGPAPVPAECVTTTAAAFNGQIVYPVDKSTDRKNYGNSGSSWSRGHTGTDFSIGCGTPVKAAHDGTAQIDTTQAWAGRWLVKVTTGPKALTTWYAHMQGVAVENGQQVAAGQTIGQVGSEGNSTGCHLHFEVHPTNGGIYDDGVNPTTWLAQNVGPGNAPQVTPVTQATSTGPAAFRIASLNVLGASHTDKSPAGGRTHHGWPPWQPRLAGAIRLLNRYGVSIAGLQEFQGPQRAGFMRMTSGWGMWAAKGDAANAIVWRSDQWTPVATSYIVLPYFHGKPKRYPLVELRSRVTGRSYVVGSFHNPANVNGPAEKWRNIAAARQLALANRLISGGKQVLWTGDFNEHHTLFCKLTRAGTLHSMAGGSTGLPCRPPSWKGIDWVFGSPGVKFTGWTANRGTRAAKITDHPIIVAGVGR